MNFIGIILESIKEIFTGKVSFGSVLYVVFLMGAALVIASMTERMGNYLFFRSMEKRVTILEDLYTLSRNGIKNDPELAPIYQDTVNKLEKHDIITMSDITTDITTKTVRTKDSTTTEKLIKFFSSAWLGILVMAVGLSHLVNDPANGKKQVSSGFVFVIIMGIFGAAIPTFEYELINYCGWPFLQIAIIVWLMRKTSSRVPQNKPEITP